MELPVLDAGITQQHDAAAAIASSHEKQAVRMAVMTQQQKILAKQVATEEEQKIQSYLKVSTVLNRNFFGFTL